MSWSYSSTSEWLRPWVANANHLSNPAGGDRPYRLLYVRVARSNVVDWAASFLSQLVAADLRSGRIGCGAETPPSYTCMNDDTDWGM